MPTLLLRNNAEESLLPGESEPKTSASAEALRLSTDGEDAECTGVDEDEQDDSLEIIGCVEF